MDRPRGRCFGPRRWHPPTVSVRVLLRSRGPAPFPSIPPPLYPTETADPSPWVSPPLARPAGGRSWLTEIEKVADWVLGGPFPHEEGWTANTCQRPQSCELTPADSGFVANGTPARLCGAHRWVRGSGGRHLRRRLGWKWLGGRLPSGVASHQTSTPILHKEFTPAPEGPEDRFTSPGQFDLWQVPNLG